MNTLQLTLALTLALNICNIAKSSEQYTILQLPLLSESMLPTIPKGAVVDVRIPNYVTADVYCRGCITVYKSQNFGGTAHLNIHRVIGISGDKVSYSFDARGGAFSVNNTILTKSTEGIYTYLGSKGLITTNKSSERVGDHVFSVLSEPKINIAAIANTFFGTTDSENFPILIKEKCAIGSMGFECVVPEGYIFVIGDNRNQSLYGIVPIDHIVGYVSATPSVD